MEKFSGIMATTHLDKHNERLDKESLEKSADAINNSDQSFWITWNHQSTLPPIGIVERAWVEQMPDEEYALHCEGILFEEEERLGITRDFDVRPEDLSELDLKLETLDISHDPRNFTDGDIKQVIEELSIDVPVGNNQFIRKSEVPQSVIFVIAAFVGGGIAGGFLNRIGEVAADKAIEVTKPLLQNIGKKLGSLTEKTIPGDQPDYIIKLQIPGIEENVEGAIESPSPVILKEAFEKLPELYAYTGKVLSQNQPGYFQDIKFLYNPFTNRWEVNYLTIKKSKKIVYGRRYIVPDHPLRLRYEQELKRINDSGKRE